VFISVEKIVLCKCTRYVIKVVVSLVDIKWTIGEKM